MSSSRSQCLWFRWWGQSHYNHWRRVTAAIRVWESSEAFTSSHQGQGWGLGCAALPEFPDVPWARLSCTLELQPQQEASAVARVQTTAVFQLQCCCRWLRQSISWATPALRVVPLSSVPLLCSLLWPTSPNPAVISWREELGLQPGLVFYIGNKFASNWRYWSVALIRACSSSSSQMMVKGQCCPGHRQRMGLAGLGLRAVFPWEYSYCWDTLCCVQAVVRAVVLLVGALWWSVWLGLGYKFSRWGLGVTKAAPPCPWLTSATVAVTREGLGPSSGVGFNMGVCVTSGVYKATGRQPCDTPSFLCAPAPSPLPESPQKRVRPSYSSKDGAVLRAELKPHSSLFSNATEAECLIAIWSCF